MECKWYVIKILCICGRCMHDFTLDSADRDTSHETKYRCAGACALWRLNHGGAGKTCKSRKVCRETLGNTKYKGTWPNVCDTHGNLSNIIRNRCICLQESIKRSYGKPEAQPSQASQASQTMPAKPSQPPRLCLASWGAGGEGVRTIPVKI